MTSRSGTAILAAAFAVAIALIGCTSAPEATPEPAATAPAAPEEPAEAMTVEDRFFDRPKLASCGEFVLGHDDTVPQEARDCLTSAATDEGAELLVSSPTTEGDPIVTYYRMGPGIEGIEVFSDATADRFGDQEWTYGKCQGEPVIDERGFCAIS